MTVAVFLGLLAIAGVPLFVVIAAGALWGYQQAGIDLQAIAIEVFGVAEMPVLAAIPLFTFAGYLLSEGGAPQRLVGPRAGNAMPGRGKAASWRLKWRCDLVDSHSL